MLRLGFPCPRLGMAAGAPLDLASVHPESKQHVPGSPEEAAITGIDVHHSADDNRARAIDRAAFRPDAVHRREVAIGVELPQDRPVFGCVRPDAAIVRAREHGSRDCGDCTALRSVAPLVRSAQLRRRRHGPDALARLELHRMHAARLLTEEVADAEIRLLSVDRRTPLSTEAAALAKAVLPDERTFLVRIERICHPG